MIVLKYVFFTLVWKVPLLLRQCPCWSNMGPYSFGCPRIPLLHLFLRVCVFCIPQWIVWLWLWIWLAALPGCLAEEAWPTLEWQSSGFWCSRRAPTSAGSGPSTRLSSELNVSRQHPDESVSRRNVVFCATAFLWRNKISSARLTRQSKAESAVKQSRKCVFCKKMWTQWWNKSLLFSAKSRCTTKDATTTHSFMSLRSWLT